MKKLLALIAGFLLFATSAFAQLGSLSSDLVFTPITPCRIVDTRNAGGVIPSATSRVFKGWAANYTAQGGSATNCGLPQTSNIAALAVNLLVIVPAAEGWIAAWPVGVSMPLVSNLNYKANDVLANSAILKISQSSADFNLYTTTTTHFVADVTGYYSRPVATALNCTTTAGVTGVVAASGTIDLFASACPAGFTTTDTNCRSSTWDVYFAAIDNGQCSGRNLGGGASTITATRRCCQIPGR